jgi:glycosyltransferase involved in cell wall biosynthesis
LTRIAFAFGNSTAWLGGLLFYENLLTAISLTDDSKKHTLLAVIPGGDARFNNLSSRFNEVHYLPSENPVGKVLSRVAPILSARNAAAWLSPESALSRSLRQVKADVAFLKEDPLANFRTPNVCWIPDFQYLHLPEMFSPPNLLNYERITRNTARFADRIMLSSESAHKDFLSVAPEFNSKSRVVPFVAFIDDDIYADDPVKIAQEYHLPDRFFYLPNQFWKHKNHSVIIEALSLLKESGQHITVAASGPMYDHRNAAYSSELIAEISRRGLRSQFILLGMLPRRHVYALVRQSVAVLQPSLFEGWSTSIEEAKSLGKPVIASRLDVHLEQNAPGALYFAPHDPRELAQQLIQLNGELNHGVDIHVEARARESMRERSKAFGVAFLTMACDAIAV